MTNLEKDFLQRNARLLAWYAAGLPVEAAWRKETNLLGQVVWFFRIRCMRCDRSNSGHYRPEIPLWRQEAGRLYGLPCDHLDPIIGDTVPPELMPSYELELLAADFL